MLLEWQVGQRAPSPSLRSGRQMSITASQVPIASTPPICDARGNGPIKAPSSSPKAMKQAIVVTLNSRSNRPRAGFTFRAHAEHQRYESTNRTVSPGHVSQPAAHQERLRADKHRDGNPEGRAGTLASYLSDASDRTERSEGRAILASLRPTASSGEVIGPQSSIHQCTHSQPVDRARG